MCRCHQFVLRRRTIDTMYSSWRDGRSRRVEQNIWHTISLPRFMAYNWVAKGDYLTHCGLPRRQLDLILVLDYSKYPFRSDCIFHCALSLLRGEWLLLPRPPSESLCMAARWNLHLLGHFLLIQLPIRFDYMYGQRSSPHDPYKVVIKRRRKRRWRWLKNERSIFRRL